MSNTYSKKEKLKSKKLIEQLFTEGQSVSVFPLRMVYLKTTESDEKGLKCGVSVSKRHFKKAVDRNRIKRLLREAYRLNKLTFFNNSSESYALMILYISKDGTDFESVNKKMKQLLEAFSKKVSQQ